MCPKNKACLEGVELLDEGGFLVHLDDEGDVLEQVGVVLDKLVPRVVGPADRLDQGLIFKVLSHLLNNRSHQ